MKVKVRSWSKWDEDGLIEVMVDKDVLREYVKDLEKQISDAIFNKKYTKAYELIGEREKIVEQLENCTGEEE